MSNITEVFNRYHKMMLYVANRILGNMSLAEDAVQNAFVKIIRHPEQVQAIPIDDLKPYLIVVSENSARSLYRQRNKFDETPLENVELYDSNQESNILDKVQAINIFNMPQLSPQYRDVIILKYYYDLDTKTIAKTLDISESNVRVRLTRARELIRNVLDGQEVG